jgi:hypothetical protein
MFVPLGHGVPQCLVSGGCVANPHDHASPFASLRSGLLGLPHPRADGTSDGRAAVAIRCGRRSCARWAALGPKDPSMMCR